MQTFKSNQVNVFALLHSIGLRSKDLIEFLAGSCKAEKKISQIITSKALQIEACWRISVIFLLFIASIGNSLKKYQFQVFIRSKLYEWEKSLLKSHKLTMEVDQEFANIFEQSQMVFVKIIIVWCRFSPEGQITSLVKEGTSQTEERCRY